MEVRKWLPEEPLFLLMGTSIDLVRIEKLVLPVLDVEGFELVDLRYLQEAGRWVLRFYLDKPGGVTVADCERASRKIEAFLDMEDVMPASYSLEVSSPGLDRVLKREADFQRFSGQKVKVRARTGVNGQRKFKGLLKGAEGGRIHLSLPEEKEVDLEISDIEEARLDPDIKI